MVALLATVAVLTFAAMPLLTGLCESHPRSLHAWLSAERYAGPAKVGVGALSHSLGSSGGSGLPEPHEPSLALACSALKGALLRSALLRSALLCSALLWAAPRIPARLRQRLALHPPPVLGYPLAVAAGG
jgi:hypothetical protein